MAGRDDQAARELPETLHEVGNALTVVVGWIDLALASLSPDGPAVEALEVARRRAVRAQQLARRAIGGAPHVDPPRPLADVVREVARGLAAARSGAVVVEAEIEEGLGGAYLPRGDAAGQVLTNLVLNALQVSDVGGTVRVRAHRSGPGAVDIEVVDEGPGVPDELRDSLFTSGRTSRPDGVGIGLRHAATLALEVGGSLAHTPSARGATFSLHWPVVGTEAVVSASGPPASLGSPPPSWPPGIALRALARGPAARPHDGPLEGRRLLLVEDDVAVVDLLEAALEAQGAAIEVVRDAGAFAEALTGPAFDFVLLDLSPLGAHVATALGALRRHSATARIVVISGSLANATDLPTVDAWVRKPFEVADVLRALASR